MSPAPSTKSFRPTLEQVQQGIPVLEQQKAEILKKIQAEEEEFENVKGRMNLLKKKIDAQLEAEGNLSIKPYASENEETAARLTQAREDLEKHLPGMAKDLKKIERQIQALNEQLQACAKQIEGSNRMIAAEYRASGEVPNSLFNANHAYQNVLQIRAEELTSAREQFFIPGAEAMQQVIRPFWDELNRFLETIDDNKLATGLGLYLRDYPVIDGARAERVASAFELLPGSSDPKARAATVRAVLMAYVEARKKAATDSGNVITHLKTLDKATVELKKLPLLWGAENESAAIAARQTNYTQVAESIQKQILPTLLSAEQNLRSSLKHPSDRELLVKAQLEETKEGQETSSLEKLKTDKDQTTYFEFLLEKVGVPVTVDQLQQALTRRVAQAKAANKALTTEHAMLDEWREEMILLIDPDRLSEEVQKAVKKRRLVLNLSLPSKEAMTLLLNTAPPTTPADRLKLGLLNQVTEYFEQLKDKAPGKQSIKTPEALRTAFKSEFDPLLYGFKSLLSGETRTQQEGAGITNEALRPSIKEVDELVQRIGFPASMSSVSSGSKPEPVREARRFVDGFVGSMERVSALEAEREAFQTVRKALMELSSGEGAEMVAEYTKLSTRLKLVKEREAKIVSYVAGREFSTEDPDTSELAVLKAEWPVQHAEALEVQKRNIENTKREIAQAKEALDKSKRDLATRTDRSHLGNLIDLEEALRTKNVAKLKAQVRIRDSELPKLGSVQVGTKSYTAPELLKEVFEGWAVQPLVNVSGWMPPALKSLTLDEIVHKLKDPADPGLLPQEVLAREYSQIEGKLRDVRMSAVWFAQNFKGRPVESSILGIKYTKYEDDAYWKVSLVEQCGKVRDLLTAVVQSAEEEHAIALKRSREATTLAKPPARTEQLHSTENSLLEAKNKLTNTLREMKRVLDTGAQAEPKELLNQAYAGLRQVVFSHSNTLPNEEKVSAEAFLAVISPLALLRQDPTVSKKMIDLVKEEQRRLAECTDALPGLANKLKTEPKVGFEATKQKVEAKEASFVAQANKISEKEAALAIAEGELTRLEGQTFDSDVAAFLQETQTHIQEIDPENMVMTTDMVQLILETETAKGKVSKLKGKIREALDANAKRYREWLLQKQSLTTPTGQPTELERVGIQETTEIASAFFTLFANQGAEGKEETDPEQFKRWFEKLARNDAEGWKDFMNELIVGVAL